jgi:predicted RND superfamily exporter protein
MRKVSGSVATVLFVLIVTLIPMLYGNLIVKRGGLLDDSLLNKEDPSYIMDKRAEALMARELETSDVVTLVMTFNPRISAKDLQRVQTLTDELKTAFPEYAILSLSVVPMYRDTGEELLNRPYIDDKVLEEISSDDSKLGEWRSEVARDPSVYGILIGRQFDYATVNMLLPRGFDEIATFRRIAGFLEQRDIPGYEWLFKGDIRPAEKYKGITVAGWATACGLMDAALTSDMMKLTSMGLMLAGMVLYFSLRSRRQALMAILVIVVCFIWTRGSIGLLQRLGFELYERVYVLLVYTAIIISGISFVERKLECYNEARGEFPDDSRGKIWKRTRRTVDGVIFITALTALVNFGALYQIGIRGILEVGIFSALGIGYLLFLVLWFLPALHMVMGGEAALGQSVRSSRVADMWDRFLQRVVTKCHEVLDPSSQNVFVYHKKAMLALSVTAALATTALLMIASDYAPFVHKDFQFLHVRTRPLDYLPGTIVHRASETLNREGSYGFDRLSVLALPKNEAGIHDPGFISRIDELKRRIGEMENVREVTAITDILSVISRESHGTALPQSESEIHDALRMIEWDLGPELKEQLWFDKGLILFVSFSADDSNKTGEIVDGILRLSRDAFPDLDVLPFGKFLTYPRSDRYIREGKPWNAVSSMWIVVVICASWIMWRHRSLRDSHSHFRLRPWSTGVAISVPFVLGSAVIVLVMILLRIPLDQATACITALAINAAIDFSLYMVADYQTAILSGKDLREALRYALPVKGKIIVIDILLNSLCFAPLMASRFIPVQRMGWIMIVMLMACGFGSLVLLPALLPWCVRNVDQGHMERMAP